MYKGINKIDKANNEQSIFEVEYTWWEKMILPLEKVFYWLKDKRQDSIYRRQRARKGYSNSDVWEMRYWFIKTARPMLLDFSKKTYNHPDGITFDEWHNILDTMAELLAIIDMWDDTAARKKLNIEIDDHSSKSMELITEEQERAKNEFFALFSKWFYHLWY